VSTKAAKGGGWPSLGVVVPVYNEADGIEASCREILGAVGAYAGHVVVIAVDDGSRDSSAEIVGALAQELPGLELVRHAANAGYGAALRTGARRAQELGLRYVAFIDSDLTNPPSDLLTIAELARQGHRYIKASRFVRGGSMSSVPIRRRWVSRLGNLIAAALFGTQVRDVTNGFRGAETELICSWPTHERGFAVIVEEFAWALASDVPVAEFPTVLTARSAERRATAFSYSPQLLMSYLRYPLRSRLERLRRRA
jgi:glycosyltransferase involved in cell wall biosynthesis